MAREAVPASAGRPSAAGRLRQSLAAWVRIRARASIRQCTLARLQRANCPRSSGLAQLLLSVSVKEINRMFDNVFGIHQQGLLLHGQRIGVLATNIANADTRNYKGRDIHCAEVRTHAEGPRPMR